MAGSVGKGREVPAFIPFSYRAGNSVLHRAPAGLKLLCLPAISLAAYSSLAGLAAAVITVLAASITSRIPPWQLLKGSLPVLILSIGIILLKTINPALPYAFSAAGFAAGTFSGIRLLTSYASAALLFALTTMRELRLSIGAIEKRLTGGKFGRPGLISVAISLMLGFLQRFFELWETMNLACEARSCPKGPRRFILLIPLVTSLMMEAAADTALALEARGMR